ncbi:recombination protein RecX [Streptococcus oralis subsp. oralis]|uniref:Recombination protein RecX n=1 Tax=Streptococcus oralis subsp. oralis TaxID=1891914 RepID=A0A1X1HR66_STROR|nr:sigma(X)-activator ComW [Streptococcus oralis]ORO63289.1 recombination protein RecX [Streptococcus oralis subsp. oralis]
MLQKFYDRAFVFLKLVEQEYASLGQSCSEWESLHLRFLLYYLIRFKIKSDRDFSLYHFRTAYRLYLDKLLQCGTTFIQ